MSGDKPEHPGENAQSGYHLPKRRSDDGFSQGYEPVHALDPRKIHSVNDLVRAMGQTSFTARRVGEAADLLERMVKDERCTVICTISGAMTVAKLSLVVCEMIERGMIHALVTTGALMAHGLVEAQGLTHFKCPPNVDDAALFEAGFDRVYDTLELEQNLDDTEAFLLEVMEDQDPAKPVASWNLLQRIGQILSERDLGRGILRSAYEHDVPVYVPAFTDSELGLDFALLNRRRAKRGLPPFQFDAIADLEHYTRFYEATDRAGIFTIGGGVPRNWAQQVSPYLDLIRNRLGGKGDDGFRPFLYGVRICPDPPHFGHLSGCTYEEGVSWGKFVPRDKGGAWVEVMADATLAWPLIVQAVCERMD